MERATLIQVYKQAHDLTDKLEPTRYTRSVSSKKVLSRWRHLREEQPECLRRQTKEKLVRSPGGRYEAVAVLLALV